MVVIRVVASPCIDPRGASPLFPVARGTRVAISCTWAQWQAAAISPRTSDAKLALKRCDRKGSLKSPEPIANPIERPAINTNQPVWDRGFLSRSLMANSAYSSAREDALAALADWSPRDARGLGSRPGTSAHCCCQGSVNHRVRNGFGGGLVLREQPAQQGCRQDHAPARPSAKKIASARGPAFDGSHGLLQQVGDFLVRRALEIAQGDW